MKKFIYFVIFIVFSFSLWAAPSLLITKPPVTPVPSWTGPVQDPDAILGQWIYCIEFDIEQARPYEFYDNVEGDGGGLSSWHAIEGVVVSIVYAGGTGTNILAFDIDATITNDTPALTPWLPGSNSHLEALSTEEQYEGTLFNTVLTADFAISDLGNLPLSWVPPYYDYQPYIIAVNEDVLAWYCWTPENPETELQPWGSYYVPAWRFYNIPQGGSFTRSLQFMVDGAGLAPGDPRYPHIENSLYEGNDVFLNRTTSLKISEWIDEIDTDTQVAYPIPPARSSDVSVFHNLKDEPCPVELSSFYGTYINGIPTLYWTTQTETNNEYWNVYRGINNEFELASLLNDGDPIAGQGTTQYPTDYIYVDTAPVVQNTTYWYWIESVATDGESEAHVPITLSIPYEDTPITPDTYGLHQNYPNPFNPSTSISFALAEDSDVELIIYNVKGAKIRTIFTDHVYANDITSVVWDGNDADGKKVSSGVYFYKLITETKEYQRKMLLVK